jgi:hypothetical protein
MLQSFRVKEVGAPAWGWNLLFRIMTEPEYEGERGGWPIWGWNPSLPKYRKSREPGERACCSRLGLELEENNISYHIPYW